jgi:p-hydroxybenzoate 3-monooxygenase
MNTSVAIIGAGPAGLLAATLLIQSQIDCVVYERLGEEATRSRARAGAIDAHTVDILDSYGLANGLRQHGSTTPRCEFRRDGIRYFLEFGNGIGVQHFYPQQLLVGDLIDALRVAGGDVRFNTPVERVDTAGRPTVVLSDGNKNTCDFVIGCDGPHGPTRLATKRLSCRQIDEHAQWLALLAEVDSPTDHVVYGLHHAGFAGQMPRSATVNRFYLQVKPETNAEDWTTDRIWLDLESRLGAEKVNLDRGRITQRQILKLRSYVTEPMQQGAIFLAGDAAHLVTPAGGKGMNLALQDAAELAAGLIRHYHDGKTDRLEAYTTTRLPAVWHAVEFSHWMLGLLLARPARGRFRECLRRTRLDRIMADGSFAYDFALNYTGQTIGPDWSDPGWSSREVYTRVVGP